MKIWKTAHKFPLYEVSNYGEVRRITTGRIIKPNYNKHLNNYATISLLKKKGQRNGRSRSLARLVLKTFQYELARKKVALHFDMNHMNNNNDNLTWSTRGDLYRYKRSGKLKGVYPWKIGHNKFRAALKIKNKVRTLGYFRTYEEAQKVYYEAFVKNYGYEPFQLGRIT